MKKSDVRAFNEEKDKDTFSDLDDDELDDMVLTDEQKEVKVRTHVVGRWSTRR